MSTTVWHGLRFSFAVTPYDASPGVAPSFTVEDVELEGVEDVDEFRESHPFGEPEEITKQFEEEIHDYIDGEVLAGDVE